MKRAKFFFKISVVISVLLLFYSCNPLEKTTSSNSLLVVENMMGVDIEGNAVSFLQSDVAIIDQTTGQGSVRADVATVTLKAMLMNPDPKMGTSEYSDIIVTRYVVSYSRSDGRNTPGRDVPYSFEGSMSTLIGIGTSQEVSFVIVREVAKMEPPLVYLATTPDVIQVTAQVDFYGQDMVNNKVKATGYLTIFFANYADM